MAEGRGGFSSMKVVDAVEFATARTDAEDV